jgi:Ca2+-transporting ATPase
MSQDAGRTAPEYQQPVERVVVALRTDVRRGLTADDARTRLERFGPNELAQPPAVRRWRRFLAQFEDVLVVLLLVATAISAALWLYERDTALPFEAIAISAIVLLNAVIGYVQEARAETAIAALRQMSAERAHAIRGGDLRTIPAADLVPGDIILIEAGDVVPADARLIELSSLQTSEAALTGESLTVLKNSEPITGDAAVGDRLNMIFKGTSVTSGRGYGVVVATGMQTEVGRIAGMLAAEPHETTPLQRELARIGRTLGLVVSIIAVGMIATILLVENVRGISALLDVLILGVALAVAAVPEGLPAIVTAVLSIGVQRMARRNAIVRHLSAVETLGSASVIATDKTGTLTRNEMAVREVVTASGRAVFDDTGYAPSGDVPEGGRRIASDFLRAELDRTLTAAHRASNAVLQQREGRWLVQGDPMEGAILIAARKAGLDAGALERRFERIAEVPFSSDRRMMSTVHTDADADGRVLTFTKGAPEVLLPRCISELHGEDSRPLSGARRAQILETNELLAGRALRTLGVAFRITDDGSLSRENVGEHVERDLVFAGLLGIMDPPRTEAAGAVARAKSAGIRPVMITGDHPRTASIIGQELGLDTDGRAVSGRELQGMNDETMDATVRSVAIYARVSPEDKLRIVRALQRTGGVVAMTGDGVNDAPALKAADIGIAMGAAGTDVARQAADIVLADDNFATIVAAVEEGRSIFSNIRKSLRYLLSSNIGEVMTMFFGILLAKRIGLDSAGAAIVLPLTASQLLWINLLTDGAPAIALGVDSPDPGLMARPPRPAGEGIVTRRMWIGIFAIGAIMAIGSLYILDADLPGGFVAGGGTLRHAQTMTFTTLMLFQLFNVFNARSDEESSLPGLLENRWLLGAIALSILLQLVVVYVPFLQQAFSTEKLSGFDWLRCTAVASSVLWLWEIQKALRRLARK